MQRIKITYLRLDIKHHNKKHLRKTAILPINVLESSSLHMCMHTYMLQPITRIPTSFIIPLLDNAITPSSSF